MPFATAITIIRGRSRLLMPGYFSTASRIWSGICICPRRCSSISASRSYSLISSAANRACGDASLSRPTRRKTSSSNSLARVDIARPAVRSFHTFRVRVLLEMPNSVAVARNGDVPAGRWAGRAHLLRVVR
ncbi:hypothetical protein [Rhodococcus sp. ABRD24]|uniref:hypothetical protein n=1 Tax=Rhodococcus sp. ABRD24 TaxID=2507582 RepID=UPI0013F168D8|nr:hypothetical protein [Rhodococcus sp. ABRD24]